jgi:hypothetical protein
MESPKKCAKVATNNDNNEQDCPLLRILDEDSLRQVLLRACASDHEALRKTCLELSRVLDSDHFRRERIQNEWAEIEVTLVVENEISRSEDEDEGGSVVSDSSLYGMPSGTVLRRDFCIKVNGKKAGDGLVTLISRNTNRVHKVCNAISQDLQDVSCLFFDARGRPRVASVKGAIDSQPCRNKGFLYIDKVKWHRAIDCDSKSTWLGATAIRSLPLTRESFAWELDSGNLHPRGRGALQRRGSLNFLCYRNNGPGRNLWLVRRRSTNTLRGRSTNTRRMGEANARSRGTRYAAILPSGVSSSLGNCSQVKLLLRICSPRISRESDAFVGRNCSYGGSQETRHDPQATYWSQ